MRNLSWSSCWGQHKKSTATSAPTFIWRVRWKISKSTNHSSDYVCDVIWRQRLRASRGWLNLSAILPNRPADSRAKRIDSPGCWTLAFAFKALPVACFTADLLSIYVRFRQLCVDLLFGGSIYFCAVRFIFGQVGLICMRFDLFSDPLNVCTRFILFILWLEDFGRNGTP